MKGVVVELDFENTQHKYTDFNGKRGFIEKIVHKNPLKYLVHIDNGSKLKIDNTFLKKVYCLGFPCEYWMTEKSTTEDLLIKTLSSIKTDVFYVFAQSYELYTTVFIVNYKILEIACENMTTEPLLRIYGMKKKQEEVKLIFDQCCANLPDDLTKPWFTDLSSNFFLNIISRYQSCEDPLILRNSNFHDYVGKVEKK